MSPLRSVSRVFLPHTYRKLDNAEPPGVAEPQPCRSVPGPWYTCEAGEAGGDSPVGEVATEYVDRDEQSSAWQLVTSSHLLMAEDPRLHTLAMSRTGHNIGSNTTHAAHHNDHVLGWTGLMPAPEAVTGRRHGSFLSQGGPADAAHSSRRARPGQASSLPLLRPTPVRDSAESAVTRRARFQPSSDQPWMTEAKITAGMALQTHDSRPKSFLHKNNRSTPAELPHERPPWSGAAPAC